MFFHIESRTNKIFTINPKNVTIKQKHNVIDRPKLNIYGIIKVGIKERYDYL